MYQHVKQIFYILLINYHTTIGINFLQIHLFAHKSPSSTSIILLYTIIIYIQIRLYTYYQIAICKWVVKYLFELHENDGN